LIVSHSYKVELDPNTKQKTTLVWYAGVKRHVWNWGLNRVNEEYKKSGNRTSYWNSSGLLRIETGTSVPEDWEKK
jgi:hypothetical protein